MARRNDPFNSRNAKWGANLISTLIAWSIVAPFAMAETLSNTQSASSNIDNKPISKTFAVILIILGIALIPLFIPLISLAFECFLALPLLIIPIIIWGGIISLVVEAFGNKDNKKKKRAVQIPLGATEIKNDAYRFTNDISEIIIPNSVLSIGDRAFINCKNIEKILIPNNVASIGEYTFRNCEKLKEIIVDDENPNYDSRDNCNAIIESVNNKIIIGCNKSIIPESVTSIADGAFRDCKKLPSIIFPNSIVYIGEHAFEGCSALTKVIIPDSVNGIGYKAFAHCTELKYLSIGGGVTNFGEAVFHHCIKLTSVLIQNGVTRIGDGLFVSCEAIQEIILPNSLKTIGNYAFKGCSSLKTIEIPNNVTEIGEYAFCSCLNIESIRIPDGVKEIRNSTFSGCSNLETIVIPNSVTSIGENAFSNCTKLKSITIPNSIVSIKRNAFWGCKNLVKVNIENITLWCKVIFQNYFSNPLWRGLDLYCNGEIVKKISFTDDNITEIKPYTFYGCTSIKEAVFDKHIKEIGCQSFRFCHNLEKVTIEKTTRIREQAFDGCEKLILLKQ